MSCLCFNRLHFNPMPYCYGSIRETFWDKVSSNSNGRRKRLPVAVSRPTKAGTSQDLVGEGAWARRSRTVPTSPNLRTLAAADRLHERATAVGQASESKLGNW